MIYFKEEEFLSSCACHVVIGKEDQQRKRSEKKRNFKKYCCYVGLSSFRDIKF